MTPLLLSVLIVLTLYGVYIATRVARLGAPASDFLDAGQALPGWAAMFLLPGLAMAGLGVERHLLLVARYGLQASHLALGIVLLAIAALLVWNRMWYVTRVAGLATPGEALARFYGSVTLRVVVIGLAIVYALPFGADILSFAAQLLDRATGGFIPRVFGVWLLAIALAIPAIIGGWRATILTLAMYSLLLIVLVPALAAILEIVLGRPGFPLVAIPVLEGVLWDRLPGVVQYSAGIGKDVPTGGIFTTLALASSAIALLGLIFSPATVYLGQTVRQGGALGVSAVWLTGGLVAGLMTVAIPSIAARAVDQPVALATQLYAIEPLAGVAFIVMLLIGSLLAVAFFVTGGCIIVMRELVLSYLLPSLTARQQRVGTRIALGFTFFFVASMASFLPLTSAVLASLALPLSVQLLPAFLGITFVRWISRGAVLTGMIFGILIVLFTEPPGLILFEALFVDLPWGRWPLTINSAAWGLAFNMLFVLLASAVTLRAPDALQRERLHNALVEASGTMMGGRGLFWALMLLWCFAAFGPGAILGNSFFSNPIFSSGEAALGIPSLWVWQLLFWLLGVVLIWWLAYRVGLGRTDASRVRVIVMPGAPSDRPPDWLASSLSRVAARSR